MYVDYGLLYFKLFILVHITVPVSGRVLLNNGWGTSGDTRTTVGETVVYTTVVIDDHLRLSILLIIYLQFDPHSLGKKTGRQAKYTISKKKKKKTKTMTVNSSRVFGPCEVTPSFPRRRAVKRISLHPPHQYNLTLLLAHTFLPPHAGPTP
jgi:hypothetical protein